MINKLSKIYRRLSLGQKFNHQYICPPQFDLIRQKDSCNITWNKQDIATIPYAYTFKHSVSSQTCFIVASGPSLQEVDLGKIGIYHSLSLNCAIKKFVASELKPTHCLVVDHRVFTKQWSCIRESILSGAHCFFSFGGIAKICEREPDLLKRGNIYLIESITRKYGLARLNIKESKSRYFSDPDLFMDISLADYARSIGFSTNLEKGLFSGKTVATWAVQLAVCLGYKNICILGMDLGGTGNTHFYSDANMNPPDFMADYEPHIRACFELAKIAGLKLGVSIYNLSLNSHLPDNIIPKISFDEALIRLNTNTPENNL